MIKEKVISELILKHKLLKKRFIERQGIQEKTRKELKTYENLNILNMLCMENKIVQNNIRYLEQIIFENKILLNALQKQCLDIKKKIKKLNKEQNIRNNKKLEKHGK
jgi:hypothetical protein